MLRSPGRASALAVCVPLALLLASAAWLHADDDDAAPVSLSFEIPVGRPLLVIVETHMKGDIEVESADYFWSDDFEINKDIVVIDEFVKRNEHSQVATRRYTRHLTKVNGEVADRALNGAVVDYSYREDKTHVQLLDDRFLTDRDLSYLLSSFPSVGVGLELPKEAIVGEQLEVNLAPLFPLLVLPLDEIDATGRFTLESFSHLWESGKLVGKCEMSGEGEILEVDVKLTISGNMTIEFNAGESRITSVTFDGKYQYSSSGSGSASGDGVYTAKLTTEIDPKKIKQERRRRPRFRTRKIRAYRMGVGFKLPSYYSRISANFPDRTYVRTIDADKGQALIELSFVDVASDNANFIFDKVYASLKSKNPGVQYRKCKNPLERGEGRTYFVPDNAQSGAEDATLVVADVYPWNGRFVLFQLIGPPRAFQAVYKDYLKARSTLKPLRSRSRR